LALGLIKPGDRAVLDSTAHALKFAEFQNRYFEDDFGPEFEIKPKPELCNRPGYVRPADLARVPEPGRTLDPEDFQAFVRAAAREIAQALDLKPKDA